MNKIELFAHSESLKIMIVQGKWKEMEGISFSTEQIVNNKISGTMSFFFVFKQITGHVGKPVGLLLLKSNNFVILRFQPKEAQK